MQTPTAGAAAEAALGMLFGPELTRGVALRLLGTPLLDNPHHMAVPVGGRAGGRVGARVGGWGGWAHEGAVWCLRVI